MNWMTLHDGAKFGPHCDDIVHERELEFTKYIGHVNTASKPVGKWIGTEPCKHQSDTVGRCIQVGDHSPSGDSYLCLFSETKGWIHEVHQDKHVAVAHEISYEQFRDERSKSAADTDLFILFCTGKIDQQVLQLERSAYVDVSCWEQYYGPFAARAFFVKSNIPPSINDADIGLLRTVPEVGKAFADAIIEERASRRFEDAEDAAIRLKKRRKGLKNVDECVKRFRYY